MNKLLAAQLTSELRALSDSQAAARSKRYFKTAQAGAAVRDRFLGIRVPSLRVVARRWRRLDLDSIVELLESPYHEARLLALIMLVERYRAGTEHERREIYRQYMKRLEHVDNWDLVDSSAPGIVGAHLETRSRRPLYKLAGSRVIWRRRVAIVATLWFIRHGEFRDTLAIAGRLLGNDEDLIQKATGWMLREVGNRDRRTAEAFLLAHYRDMPRTMLRDAIEKLPEPRRRAYLDGRAGVRTKR
jgi:3-methyladenine DNA glycosylase AlkD